MRPLAIFYALVVYIFLQFGWWTWLLIELNSEVYSGEETGKRIWMVAGEGAVFLIILVLGVIRIRKGFKKEMEFAARQKNFLLAVTHEFKSPLAAIRLSMETLLKLDLDKSKKEELMHNAIGDTERLNLLVEKALMAARLESGSNIFKKEKINASRIAQDTLRTQASLLGRSVNIKNEIQDDVVIDFDPTAFSSLLLNLVENASKYAAAGSAVTVTLSSNDREALLAVSDEGPGVPDEEKEKIFEKFYRSGNEETRRTKGTGLGLYIARQIADAHGAVIRVKNNSPRGVVFEVQIPLTTET